MGKKVDVEPLKVGVVLTIPAAGSESSSTCVITNEDAQLKKSAGTSTLRPMFAIMKPRINLLFLNIKFRVESLICSVTS